MPGAADVQKRGAAESELEFSALPTLALSDFSLHQSGTGQGWLLGYLEARDQRSAPSLQPDRFCSRTHLPAQPHPPPAHRAHTCPGRKEPGAPDPQPSSPMATPQNHPTGER